MIKKILSVLAEETSIYDTSQFQNPNRIVFKNLIIDSDERAVHKKERNIKLTFTEFEILYLLAKNPGRVFSKEQIYNMVWKEPCIGDYNIVMSHIQNIRKKIEDDSRNPVYIQTVWGVGYRFNKEIGSNL